MFKRILVPLDGAARAERAIPVAARLARASNGSIILLQVVTPPIDYGGYLAQEPLQSESMIETYLDEAKSYLENLAKSEDLAGIGTRVEAMLDNAKTYLAAVKERLEETLKELNLTVTWSVAIDPDVADALIGIAEHGAGEKEAKWLRGCDLIAMSTHGRSGWLRWTMGSVTERVLHAAKVPLLVVRPQKVKSEHEISEDEV